MALNQTANKITGVTITTVLAQDIRLKIDKGYRVIEAIDRKVEVALSYSYGLEDFNQISLLNISHYHQSICIVSFSEFSSDSAIQPIISKPSNRQPLQTSENTLTMQTYVQRTSPSITRHSIRTHNASATARCLFGKPTAAESARLSDSIRGHLKQAAEDFSIKWNFDLSSEQPTPGEYAWERVKNM
mmetsp:Transcript_9054/g.10052  ORF Transcript_9054/g.10052 Transcript_9054/m.10052 type:complete len:187 (+) Transcript_9054:147-707(+)